MNRIQRHGRLVLGAAALLPAGWAGAAVLTVDTTEPTGAGVVASCPHSVGTAAAPGPVGERDTYTTMFPASSTLGLRGQTFTMPDNPAGTTWDLSAITVRADANAAGAGVAQDLTVGGPNTMKLWLFEWAGTSANDGSQWTTGNGASDGDPFDGTGMTNVLVSAQAFDVTRSFNGEFLHFSLPGVTLDENKAYGFLLSLEVTSGTASLRLDQARDGTAPTGETYLGGGNLRADAATESLNSSGDDLVFYVEATASVPEPASVGVLGVVGALAVGKRRGRR